MHVTLQNAYCDEKNNACFNGKCTLQCKMPVLTRKCTAYLVEKGTVMWKMPTTWSVFLPVLLKNAYFTTKQRMYVALNNARFIAKCPL